MRFSVNGIFLQAIDRETCVTSRNDETFVYEAECEVIILDYFLDFKVLGHCINVLLFFARAQMLVPQVAW